MYSIFFSSVSITLPSVTEFVGESSANTGNLLFKYKILFQNFSSFNHKEGRQAQGIY